MIPNIHLDAIKDDIMKRKKTTTIQYDQHVKKYQTINTFCLKFPPFVDAQINNCIAQGKVTRKIENKRKKTTT
jgi:hypothetical protein